MLPLEIAKTLTSSDVRIECFNDILQCKYSADDLLTLYRDANSWDGSFDWADTFDIEDACDMFADRMELARAIVYGDVTNIVEEVRLNGYGNLETVSAYELEQDASKNTEELAEWIIDNHEYCSLSLWAKEHELLTAWDGEQHA